MALENEILEEEMMDKDDIAQSITDIISSKRDMLLEYFNINVKDGMLFNVPLLLQNFKPDANSLPTFLLRLGSEVDWTDELLCFQGYSLNTAIMLILLEC
jgi:DNA mismatch repair protein MLH1